MKLADTIRLQNLHGAVAGTQATVADSRKADDWIKNYLSEKQKRLNDLREELHRKLDFNLKSYVASGPSEKERLAVSAAYNEYKDTYNQSPDKIAGGGQWAVVDPEGLIISTWKTKDEAEEAAFPVYHGIAPSSTGATAGARVMRLSDVKKLRMEAADIEAEDIFQNQEMGDRTRAKFLKHPKPKVVQLADWLREGDHRPSSHGGGAAGTGGAGGPSGGGGGTS